jgi:hypothetical protein
MEMVGFWSGRESSFFQNETLGGKLLEKKMLGENVN